VRQNLNIQQISQKYIDDTYRFLAKMFRESYQDTSDKVGYELFSDTQFEQSGNKQYLLSVLVNTEEHTTLIALDNYDNIIGTCGLKYTGLTTEIHLLYVDPAYRKSGVATRLWERARTYITTGTPIELDVFVDNYNARQIYEHWGFSCSEGQKYSFRWDTWPEHIVLEMIRYKKV
jgi:GNAT superfamily N-acetyltransferase